MRENMIFQALTTSLASVDQMDGTALVMRLMMFFIPAIIFFVLGALAQQRKRGKGKWVKYVFGLAPVIAATIFTLDFFRFSMDSFAKASGVVNQSREVLFRASPFICVAVALALIVAGVIVDRKIDDQARDVL